jgi:hypothetical protein
VNRLTTNPIMSKISPSIIGSTLQGLIDEAELLRFSDALKASRQLQSDGQRLGYDRVDLYYDDVEGDWLESWQEDKSDV